ncbi:MAG: Translation initiation factor IF-2 [candidate division CPR1 bacterium GW2011_GWA2_42_17]|uniref:Translation initiation factor IF-2 n=1 Tax=candidate division CPR1 bacterium GW2011_GWA2_42_17 TaxID=1618341 RepID=A0A0G0Z4N6_9BACT|nr:MAG: Translation initiation factor IF-2 [candidate division CPR1 bacterium GW2011_GWA2_42_17]
MAKLQTFENQPEKLVKRPPIVTIMGHVDHGKTTLLDYIRKTQIAQKEAGGITQSIGAYQVEVNGEKITFIDTPGHEAFTKLRARGGQIADIVVLVVSAVDGAMPQTIEAIAHAKAANVPIIVAFSKIDLADSSVDRVKEQLSKEGILVENWGGDVVSVPVSGKTGQGVDNLLEMILLVSSMKELKADLSGLPSGFVLESAKDEKKGIFVTLIIKSGILKTGQIIVAGNAFGKIKRMSDWQGKSLESAGPSMPVEVLGFNKIPEAGEVFRGVEGEKDAQNIILEKEKNRTEPGVKLTTSEVGASIKVISLIIKADTQGSLEAVHHSLENLKTAEVVFNFLHQGIGQINEGDIILAAASNAKVFGFRVEVDKSAATLQEFKKVDVSTYEIIYRLLEDVEKIIKGEEKPKEEIISRGKVLKVFILTNESQVAGCKIEEGFIARGMKARFTREAVVIGEAKIVSLKIEKEKKDRVQKDDIAGLALEQKLEINEGDLLEVIK